MQLLSLCTLYVPSSMTMRWPHNHECIAQMLLDGASQPGHAWLSQHYKWGLDKIFLEEGRTHAIIIEDDMIFSPDFLAFFQVMGFTSHSSNLNLQLWCATLIHKK